MTTIHTISLIQKRNMRGFNYLANDFQKKILQPSYLSYFDNNQ